MEGTPPNEGTPPSEESPPDEWTAENKKGESVLLVQGASFDLLLYAMLALLRVGREHKLVEPSLLVCVSVHLVCTCFNSQIMVLEEEWGCTLSGFEALG